MIKNIIYYSLIGLIIVTVFYYFSATSSSEYAETIDRQHKEQQRNLNEGDSLKISKELNYFTVDKNYITTAKITTFDSAYITPITFFKNTDTVLYTRIATLSFTINNQHQQLTLFKDNKTNDYILPFSDSTNHDKTHHSGRYLPIEFHHQDYIDLDFNLAYNPYCAYNINYTCAITPKENHIQTKIEAGELRY